MAAKKTTAKKTTAKKAAKRAPKKTASEPSTKVEELEEIKDSPPCGGNIRNSHGLVSGKNYIFNEDGFVDWKAMIEKKHLVVNTSWFSKYKADEPVPSKVDGLSDEQLITKLAGYKELARLRGYSSVKTTTETLGDSYSVATCTITWKGNYETDYKEVTYSSVANASLNNTDHFARVFLESIAENRAFARCVRGFLNINIVTDEEISGNDNDPKFKDGVSSEPTRENFSSESTEEAEAKKRVSGSIAGSQSVMKDKFVEKFNTDDFAEFKSFLRELWKKEEAKKGTGYQNKEASGWNSFEDVPAPDARVLIVKIKQY